MEKRLQIRNMTEGKPLAVIVEFAIPLMAASVLQQVFALTDAMILGIFGGDGGLAVLGTCSWPVWFQVSCLTGFGQAACLMAAVRFGAGDWEGLKGCSGFIWRTAIFLSIALTIVFLLLSRSLLTIQKTPETVIAQALLYLHIMYAATVFLMIYNMAAALLRAVGDSITSFLSISLSALINVGVDILFVAVFKWGPGGAAAATAMAQAMAAVICVVRLFQCRELKAECRHLKRNQELFQEYARYSIPLILQSFVIAIGGVFVQSKINCYGTVFAAGISATGKIFAVVETAAIALAQGCASFVSQNLGAGRIDRIHRGVMQTCILSVFMAAGIAVLMFVFGDSVLSLFVTEQAMIYALGDLKVINIGLLLMYPMYALRQSVQAMGNLKIPLLGGVVQLIVRLLSSQYLPFLFDYKGLYFTETMAWLSSLFLIGYIYPLQLKKCKTTILTAEKRRRIRI